MSIDQISLDRDGRGKWQEKEQTRRHGLAAWFFRKVGLYLGGLQVRERAVLYKGSRLKEV